VDVHHGVVEGGDAVGCDALGDEPCPWFVGPGLDEDTRGDVVQVRERHDVARWAPPVVHLGEAQPRPVGDQQRPVVGGDLVRVDSGHLSGGPPRELRREPLLPLPDHPHHVGDARRRHPPGGGGHPHDVVAVAVEPGAAAREEERPGVHGEGEVDRRRGVERGGAGAALPCLGDEHLEGGAAGAAGGRRELGLEVVDVVGGDVDGEVLEAGRAGRLREGADHGAGRVGHRVAPPRRGHRDALAAAGELADRAHELRRPRAVRHRVAEPEPHHEPAARERRVPGRAG
ncbi:Os05g0179450, partial [Oryza sativa Japonica Group]